MPAPVVDPSPPLRESRFGAPDDAQEASYLAASARISSLARVSSGMGAYCGTRLCSLFVLNVLSGQLSLFARKFSRSSHAAETARHQRSQSLATVPGHH